MNGSRDDEFDPDPEKLRSKFRGLIESMFSKEISDEDCDKLNITNDLHMHITETVTERCMEEMDLFWEKQQINKKLILLNNLKQSALDCSAWRPTTGKAFTNAVTMVELKRTKGIIEAELSEVRQQNVKLETELKKTSERVERVMENMKIADIATKPKV